MTSLDYLHWKFKVNRFQQFIVEWLHPVYRVFKDEPVEGKSDDKWVEKEEWKR